MSSSISPSSASLRRSSLDSPSMPGGGSPDGGSSSGDAQPSIASLLHHINSQRVGTLKGPGKPGAPKSPGDSSPDIAPSGPRKPGQGCEELEQAIMLADTTKTGVRLRITILAAGFVIGPIGASVRDISRLTGAEIRSRTVPADRLCPRDCREFLIEGRESCVVRALSVISDAVTRYKSLCEGRYAGQCVSRIQHVAGIDFAYQPPPRSIVPFAACLKGHSKRSNSSKSTTPAPSPAPSLAPSPAPSSSASRPAVVTFREAVNRRLGHTTSPPTENVNQHPGPNNSSDTANTAAANFSTSLPAPPTGVQDATHLAGPTMEVPLPTLAAALFGAPGDALAATQPQLQQQAEVATTGGNILMAQHNGRLVPVKLMLSSGDGGTGQLQLQLQLPAQRIDVAPAPTAAPATENPAPVTPEPVLQVQQVQQHAQHVPQQAQQLTHEQLLAMLTSQVQANFNLSSNAQQSIDSLSHMQLALQQQVQQQAAAAAAAAENAEWQLQNQQQMVMQDGPHLQSAFASAAAPQGGGAADSSDRSLFSSYSIESAFSDATATLVAPVTDSTPVQASPASTAALDRRFSSPSVLFATPSLVDGPATRAASMNSPMGGWLPAERFVPVEHSLSEDFSFNAAAVDASGAAQQQQHWSSSYPTLHQNGSPNSNGGGYFPEAAAPLQKPSVSGSPAGENAQHQLLAKTIWE